MSIVFDENKRVFKLDTEKSSYAFHITDSRNLLHLYYGGYIPETDITHMLRIPNDEPFGFQIEQGELVMTAYQRSSDANLGLPADIYHLYLISRQIELPLKSITLNLGNVHIYENNIDKTEQLLAGNENVKFELNV